MKILLLVINYAGRDNRFPENKINKINYISGLQNSYIMPLFKLNLRCVFALRFHEKKKRSESVL